MTLFDELHSGILVAEKDPLDVDIHYLVEFLGRH